MRLDESSFIFGLALDGQGGGKDCAADAADTPLWLHFDYSRPGAEEHLVSLGLATNVVDSLVRPDTRPRTVVTDNGALVVLRGINMNAGAEPEDMVSLRMWIEPNRLITVRQRRLQSIQDTRTRLLDGNGPATIPGLVTAIIDRLANRIADWVTQLEERASIFEEAIENERVLETPRQVTELRRQTAMVRRFLAPQREALDQFYRQCADLLNDEAVFAIREQGDRIIRYVEDLDLIRERILVMQQELLNKTAQEQNSRMYMLSLVAAVFLPITFITGLFGMNVAGLPGTSQDNAFWWVCAVMLIFGLGFLALFRFKRWF